MIIKTKEIRNKFLDFFAQNNHHIVQSSSLIPHNDASLMFVNSGMVQFKNAFTGNQKLAYTRAASSQKSVRAGGKHNDLDNVGYTTRHHTFFEMLGNFSFGDYFKEQAIFYAWELLTKEFEIPKHKLYVTIFHDDIQAQEYWRKIAGLSDERIIKISTQDNFWSMGDTGPCGPCSEIFYDHGEHIFGGLPGTKDQDGDRYVEIWNMVFMQYQQIDRNTRINLPMQSIDTGMGLERIAAVLQGVNDNYDTDCFAQLIAAIEDTTKIKSTAENKFSHRIIADHLRSCAFLIADGILPSNEGRGYVLRRIMRRSIRHMHKLGIRKPMMHILLNTLNHQMADTYPELIRASSLISQTLQNEETKFYDTLDKGLKILDQEIQNLKTGDILDGNTAFKLYDTYGFPLDLTQDILKEKNINVQINEFEENMQQQKLRARKSWAGSGELEQTRIWFDLEQKLGATEFLGYSFTESQSLVTSIVYNGSEFENFDQTDQEFWLITNQTPFYAESGGQKGDIGKIYSDSFELKVVDTKKFLKIHAHLCMLISGIAKVGSAVNMQIEQDYRLNLARNHTATHLLHSALKQVIGQHIIQKGSLVAHDRLRFDINHHTQITPDQIAQIEDLVNSIILSNLEVLTLLMNKENALQSGALALFGQKYEDEVRVISIGDDQAKLSVELCGGTHVKRTGDIGSFKIISQESVASGVRRIEALTGIACIYYIRENQAILAQNALMLQTNKEYLTEKIQDMLNDNKKLIKQLLNTQTKLIEQEFNHKAKLIKLQEFTIIFGIIQDYDNKALKLALQNLLQQDHTKTLVAINTTNKIASILIVADKNINPEFAANILINKILEPLKASGGGSKTFAQGSFDVNLIDKIQQILANIKRTS